MLIVPYARINYVWRESQKILQIFPLYTKVFATKVWWPNTGWTVLQIRIRSDRYGGSISVSRACRSRSLSVSTKYKAKLSGFLNYFKALSTILNILTPKVADVFPFFPTCVKLGAGSGSGSGSHQNGKSDPYPVRHQNDGRSTTVALNEVERQTLPATTSLFLCSFHSISA